jgi:hypothetical protein
MRIAFLFLLLFVPAAQAQVTHYHVKLTADIDRQLLNVEETTEPITGFIFKSDLPHFTATQKWVSKHGGGWR